MGLIRTALLKASDSHWLANQARNRRFAKRARSRFIPGENLDAALAAAEQLRERGLTAVLTELGENVATAAEVDGVAQHYDEVLERVEQRSLPAHISVKLTHLGLDLSRDVCAVHVSRLASAATARGNFVWIDMEGSDYTDLTLDVFRRVRAEHANVGVCLQSYLYRTADDLESLLPLSPTIRLVKGAYKEPPNIAFPHKKDVDANFLKLAERLLRDDARSNGVRPGFGTHDLRLIASIGEHASASRIPSDAFEVQMLYGIRRNDQLRLAKEGIRVRILISYGTAWFAWYMRRLAERPANLWFVMRSMLG